MAELDDDVLRDFFMDPLENATQHSLSTNVPNEDGEGDANYMLHVLRNNPSVGLPDLLKMQNTIEEMVRQKKAEEKEMLDQAKKNTKEPKAKGTSQHFGSMKDVETKEQIQSSSDDDDDSDYDDKQGDPYEEERNVLKRERGNLYAPINRDKEAVQELQNDVNRLEEEEKKVYAKKNKAMNAVQTGESKKQQLQQQLDEIMSQVNSLNNDLKKTDASLAKHKDEYDAENAKLITVQAEKEKTLTELKEIQDQFDARIKRKEEINARIAELNIIIAKSNGTKTKTKKIVRCTSASASSTSLSSSSPASASASTCTSPTTIMIECMKNMNIRSYGLRATSQRMHAARLFQPGHEVILDVDFINFTDDVDAFPPSKIYTFVEYSAKNPSMCVIRSTRDAFKMEADTSGVYLFTPEMRGLIDSPQTETGKRASPRPNVRNSKKQNITEGEYEC